MIEVVDLGWSPLTKVEPVEQIVIALGRPARPVHVLSVGQVWGLAGR